MFQYHKWSKLNWLQFIYIVFINLLGWLVGWLCFTFHQQRGHLETAPPFTVPCKGWLVVFYVTSTARSFRDGTPIYCPLRTHSSVFTPLPPGIETPAVVWQSSTLPLRHASSTKSFKTWYNDDSYSSNKINSDRFTILKCQLKK